MQTDLQTQQPPENPKKLLSASERFTKKMIKEFGEDVSRDIKLSEHHRRLADGYFIIIDRALKDTEQRRDDQSNPIKCNWDNINMDDLVRDVVTCARLGLDMTQKNHLFPIPHFNKHTKKYDITLMKGYNGLKYIAEKYAVEKPVNVVTELVYNSDKFKAIKKNHDNKIESYEFEITNPFDRGQIIGAFGYIEYEDCTKNKLVLMSIKDILKRKPDKASKNFWGDGKGESTAGWYEEMCMKTLKREIYSEKYIPCDPEKVDENYHNLRLQEIRRAQIEAQSEIDANAAAVIIDADNVIDTDITGTESDKNATEPDNDIIDVDVKTGEIIQDKAVPEEQPETPEPVAAPDF